MRVIRLLPCVIAIFVAMAQAAPAAEVLFECTFKKRGSRDGGWIPEELVLTHDAATGAVKVFDTVIDYFVGSPIKAEIKTETQQRISFGWIVTTKDPAKQQIPMAYTLNYFKDGRPATMSAIPGGYDNNFSGSGVCKRSTL